jgi:acyl carrier protein phosphodiesterase
MPGAEKKNIQEFVKKDPEERSFIKEFPQGFFNGIVLHRFRDFLQDDQELSCNR